MGWFLLAFDRLLLAQGAVLLFNGYLFQSTPSEGRTTLNGQYRSTIYNNFVELAYRAGLQRFSSLILDFCGWIIKRNWTEFDIFSIFLQRGHLPK